MNITITDQANCKKEVRLQLSSETVRAETDKTAADLARRVNIPGFRPGHVPTSVIKSRFRKDLRNQVAANLLPDAINLAAKEKNLRIVGQPSLDEFNFGDDESLNATFTIEIAPEFELASYKNIPLRRRVYKVKDEDVDREIERLRERHAELVPVEDRPAQIDDIVTANLKGHFVKEESSEAEAAKSDDDKIDEPDTEILLVEEGINKQFADALAGAQVGETRRFTVSYPEDYSHKEVAGRKVDYEAEVTAIRFKELPPLDDDFARSVSDEFNTLDELRADIRSHLEKQSEDLTKRALEKAALDYLLDRHRFDLPQKVVEDQMNSKLKSLLSRLNIEGLDLRRLDVEKLREPFRAEAERDVRASFIIDRIIEAEGIEASDEEVDKEISHLAEHMGQSAAQLKARLTRDEALDSIRFQIKNRKALDLVIDSADIQIEEVEGLDKINPPTDEEKQVEE
ncbi:MAG TPA: trigger factor [Blastocatellia bacterium]|jgi:trigger factor